MCDIEIYSVTDGALLTWNLFLPHDKLYHSGNKELMKFMEQHKCIFSRESQVDIQEAKQFFLNAAEHNVWIEPLKKSDMYGRRVTTRYDSEAFLAKTSDDPAKVTHYHVIKSLHDAASTPGVCLFKGSYSHMMDPDGKGGISCHRDKFVLGQTKRSLLNLGESENGKLLEIIECNAAGKISKDS